MNKLLSLVAVCSLLIGCETQTQTTSGSDYLARNGGGVLTKTTSSDFDNENFEDMLRRVAAVEPNLKFPARIGLARIENGRLSLIPTEEGGYWQDAQKKLGSGFGEFVPLNPLVAQMVAESVNVGKWNQYRVNEEIAKIRLGAARQHLDAVLIYEVFSKQKQSDNLLALGKLTIVGGFILPSKLDEAQGYATAMLIDVVQGYPYGSIQTVVQKESSVGSAWGWGSDRDSELSDKVEARATKQLTEEAVPMFTRLRTELAEKRAK